MKLDYQRGKTVYKGKASELCEVANTHGKVLPDMLIIARTDNVTTQDGTVQSSVEQKGAYTNRISNQLFRLLEKHGVPTHYIEELSDRETLIRRTEPFKLEVIVRNIATGSLCRRLPFQDGVELPEPLLELNYKDDAYHDPLINSQEAQLLGIVRTPSELEKIKQLALMVNAILGGFLWKLDIMLVDFKLEFGRLPDGRIIVIDEISPDTCRLWDMTTRQSLDKDVFRKGLGRDATSAVYREAFERVIAAEQS